MAPDTVTTIEPEPWLQCSTNKYQSRGFRDLGIPVPSLCASFPLYREVSISVSELIPSSGLVVIIFDAKPCQPIHKARFERIPHGSPNIPRAGAPKKPFSNTGPSLGPIADCAIGYWL
jgi:hypothetical protein